MKEEATQIHQQIKENLHDSTSRLGKAILNSEPYKNYISARDKFRSDDSAKEVARNYNTALNNYQMKSNWGNPDDEDLKQLNEAKLLAQQNEVYNNYLTSQENLISFYQELNSYISEKLSFDFASLAKPSSSCCG